MADSKKGSGSTETADEKKEPTREERIQAALGRADMSTDLKGYEKAQLDRAADVAPQRRGKALREFILHGPKDGASDKPRPVRRFEWSGEYKEQPGYLTLISRNGGDWEQVGVLQGTGTEFERNLASALGVDENAMAESLRSEEARVLVLNTRYLDVGDPKAPPEPEAEAVGATASSDE